MGTEDLLLHIQQKDSKRTGVLLIIPAYNEAENIARVVEEVQPYGVDYDYVVINDGSVDDTESILMGIKGNHITLPINLGIGGAMQTGYRYAFDKGYDIAVQLDGDGQHDVGQVSKLIGQIEAGADIAIGSRFIEKKGFQSSVARRTGIRILSWLIHFCTGIRIIDSTSGFRAVNRHYIEVFSKYYPQDYPEPESIVFAAMHGAQITETPVVMREREAGKSSIVLWKSAYYMIKVCLAIVLCKMAGKRKEIIIEKGTMY